MSPHTGIQLARLFLDLISLSLDLPDPYPPAFLEKAPPKRSAERNTNGLDISQLQTLHQ